VIRPPWKPENEEQRKLLAIAERRARQAREAVDAMWVAIQEARQAGVPDEVLCRRTKTSRATLHRRYGRRPVAADTSRDVSSGEAGEEANDAPRTDPS
jgi:hypothetical protein